MLMDFALAEAIEGEGRFLDRIMDGIWLICDEADWVDNAHTMSKLPLTPFWKDRPFVDLFGAETGSMLAWVCSLHRKKLDEISPIICERLVSCVYERVIEPFLHNDMVWMGFDGRKVSNWNPWCVASILNSTALTEQRDDIRGAVAERAARCIDVFIGQYQPDGGCDEGPGYWHVAAGSLFDCLELLWDLTGGKLDIFGETLIRRMGEYEVDFHINDEYFVNFADCPAHLALAYRMTARYGRRTGSDKLHSFGVHYARQAGWHGLDDHCQLYRGVKSLFEPLPEIASRPGLQAWYGDLGVMIEREEAADDRGMFLACKAGHNAENHNHNDVGSFIVYHNGQPVILDAGVGAYTKRTFGRERYEIWTMRSEYHNLPTINGVCQHHGPGYHAEGVEYSAGEHRLKMDICHAYPDEGGAAHYIRSVQLQGGVVTVSDDVKFWKPGSVVLTLMLGGKPILGDGFIEAAGCVIRYSPNLTARLDDFDVEMEDSSIREYWEGVEIHRVLFETGEFAEDTFTITVRAK